MKIQLIILFSFLQLSCLSSQGFDLDILGQWQITDIDRADNERVEILNFKSADSLYIEIDTDEDLKVDFIRKAGYKIAPYFGKDALFILLGANEYVWAYLAINGDKLKLDMIRVDSPRVANYRLVKLTTKAKSLNAYTLIAIVLLFILGLFIDTRRR